MTRQKSGANAYERFVCRPLNYAGAGFFCSYVLGLLLSQLAQIPAFSMLSYVAGALSADSMLIGAVVGAAVVLAFDAAPLCVLCGAVAGTIGYSFAGLFTAIIAAYICTLMCLFVYGKTRADVVLLPIVCTTGGVLCALLAAPPLEMLYNLCAQALIHVSAWPSFLAYSCIAALAALLSVTPISMFAIAAALGDGMLSGAAFIGCCAAMVSFAAASYRENGMWIALSHALGTPRLQMGNIFGNPLILLCPLLSAALGGLAAGAFAFACPAACVPQALTMLGGIVTLLTSTAQTQWLWTLLCVGVCTVAIPLVITIPLNRMLYTTRAMQHGPMRVEL
jgi:uncharacterized membrane protein